MFKAIAKFLRDRAEMKFRRAFDDGFDYAAGELLRGKSLYVMEAYCDDEPGHPFNTGMRDAVNRWVWGVLEKRPLQEIHRLEDVA